MCWFVTIFIILSITGPALAITHLRVNFNQPVTLPCEHKCSGLVQWFMESEQHDPVAWCNRTRCSSQEGFKVFHNQYLNGNLNLSISAAYNSKRTWYFCRCEGKDVCEISLSIEALISSVYKRPGEDLLLDLSITDPVDLIYNSSKSDSSSHQICTMKESVLSCNSEYKQRASLNHTVIILREVAPSDSGDYIIKDKKNGIICIYTVTVGEEKADKKQEEKSSVPSWGIVLIVGSLLVVLVIIAVVVYRWKKKPKRNQEPNHGPDMEMTSRGTEEPAENTEAKKLLIGGADGAAQIRKTETNYRNGEGGQKQYSSGLMEDHQSRDGSEQSLCLTDQNCPNGNCTTETQ